MLIFLAEEDDNCHWAVYSVSFGAPVFVSTMAPVVTTLSICVVHCAAGHAEGSVSPPHISSFQCMTAQVVHFCTKLAMSSVQAAMMVC